MTRLVARFPRRILSRHLDLDEVSHRKVNRSRDLEEGAANILIVGLDDVGADLGSPVSLDYFEQAPFAFTGKIHKVAVERK